MVWSPENLAREVRRQLIEIGSLRKRLAADPAVRASLERVEESQLFVLRKLEEHAVDESPDPGREDAEPETRAAPEAESGDLAPLGAISGTEARPSSPGRSGIGRGGAPPAPDAPNSSPPPFSLN